MGLWQRVIEGLAGREIDRLARIQAEELFRNQAADYVVRRLGEDRHLARQVAAVIRETVPATWRSEDWGWRRITSEDANRSLSPLAFDRQTDICYWLWLTNPLARRVVNIITDFVLSDGASVQAKDERAQKLLDEHWSDPYNQWDTKQFDRVLTLSLYGEYLPQVFVQKNGLVRLGYIDPKNVESIRYQPGNPERPVEVRIKGQEKTLQVITIDENPQSETYGRLSGDVFVFQVNKVPNTERGVSDLFCLADWLDALDQFLFSTLERVQFLNAFLWDVIIGTEDDPPTQELIDQRLAELQANPPKPGSFRVHGPNEKWDAVTPDLHSEDIARYGQFMERWVAGGAGIPPHWLGQPEDTNRATAQEMGEPTLKMLKRRQGYVRYMLEQIMQFQVDCAISAGSLPSDVDRTVQVVLPDLSKRDTQRVADTVTKTAQALVVAQTQNWISEKTARRVFAIVASELGVEIDPAEEEELLAEESAIRVQTEGIGKLAEALAEVLEARRRESA